MIGLFAAPPPPPAPDLTTALALAHALQRFVLDPHYVTQGTPEATARHGKALELQTRVNAVRQPGPPDWHAIAALCEAGEAFLAALPATHPIRAVLDIHAVRRTRDAALLETT